MQAGVASENNENMAMEDGNMMREHHTMQNSSQGGVGSGPFPQEQQRFNSPIKESKVMPIMDTNQGGMTQTQQQRESVAGYTSPKANLNNDLIAKENDFERSDHFS